MTTWLERMGTTCAFMRDDIACCSSGAIIWSFSASTYQLGFDRHATWVTGSFSAYPNVAPCSADRTRAWCTGRSGAKYFRYPASYSVRLPESSICKVAVHGAGGKPEIRFVTDIP